MERAPDAHPSAPEPGGRIDLIELASQEKQRWTVLAQVRKGTHSNKQF